MDALLRGIAIGFAIAAPVGPIGLLCISRTLAFGARVGFASGLGAAFADALYGIVAAAGLSAVVLIVRRLDVPLHVSGAIVLVVLGLRTAFSRRMHEASGRITPSASSALLSTFTLTVVNPATIVSFAAVVSAAGVNGRFATAAPFVTGVFLGSAFWWAALSTGVSLAGNRVTERVRRTITVGSGIALTAMGVLLLRG